MNKENHLVEYKRELSETFERSVIAFLNSTGGHVYIGINDDGSVYGVKDIDHVQRLVADRILNNIKPNAIGLFEVVTEEKDDKNIVHVAISGGPEKPYYLKKAGMTPEGCFVRVGSSGLSKEDFFNCCSMPRNRELMRIFHDLDMVEQLGSGMRRILRSYDEKAFSFTDHFMRTSFYFERFQRLGDRINDRISDRIKLTETESLIYAEIKRNPSITVPLLMHETGYSEPTINRALKALREKSCIARVGARKNGRWEALK